MLFSCILLNFGPATRKKVIWPSLTINLSALVFVLKFKSMCGFHSFKQ